MKMNLFSWFRMGTTRFLQLRGLKSDLKIKWVRPEKLPCYIPEKSGDCSKLTPINANDFLPGFEKSTELQTADPIVQSLFQLKNHSCSNLRKLNHINMVQEVQRHHLDRRSMEVQLAGMTVRIRYLQECMEKFPRNKRTKVFLKELIEKRKKFLKYLRRWDYPRFEWILEKLDLIYKPPPPKYIRITRKESVQKLTDQYCEQVRQERLQAYRQELEDRMLPFLEEKVASLEFIRKEQQDCGVAVTVTEEDIESVRQQMAQLEMKRSLADGNKEDNK